jgi:hypothetical protein
VAEGRLGLAFVAPDAQAQATIGRLLVEPARGVAA